MNTRGWVRSVVITIFKWLRSDWSSHTQVRFVMKLSQRFGLAIALLLDAAHVQWRKLTGQMGVVTKDALLLQVVGDMAGQMLEGTCATRQSKIVRYRQMLWQEKVVVDNGQSKLAWLTQGFMPK